MHRSALECTEQEKVLFLRDNCFNSLSFNIKERNPLKCIYCLALQFSFSDEQFDCIFLIIFSSNFKILRKKV